MIQFDKTKIYTKETVSQSIIRFQDCDPMGHLNNAKYFDYYFNAREDQIPKLYGINVVDFYNIYKTAWVAYNHRISYLRSALPGEWITIKSRLIFFDDTTLVTEYVMSNEDDTHFKSILWTTLKYIDTKTGKLYAHQESVKDFLNAMLSSDFDYTKTDFDQRLKQISNFYKAKTVK